MQGRIDFCTILSEIFKIKCAKQRIARVTVKHFHDISNLTAFVFRRKINA